MENAKDNTATAAIQHSAENLNDDWSLSNSRTRSEERLKQLGIEKYEKDMEIQLLVLVDYADQLRHGAACAVLALSKDEDLSF